MTKSPKMPTHDPLTKEPITEKQQRAWKVHTEKMAWLKSLTEEGSGLS